MNQLITELIVKPPLAKLGLLNTEVYISCPQTHLFNPPAPCPAPPALSPPWFLPPHRLSARPSTGVARGLARHCARHCTRQCARHKVPSVWARVSSGEAAADTWCA